MAVSGISLGVPKENYPGGGGGCFGTLGCIAGISYCELRRGFIHPRAFPVCSLSKERQRNLLVPVVKLASGHCPMNTYPTILQCRDGERIGFVNLSTQKATNNVCTWWLSGTGDLQRDSHKLIRAYHSQSKPQLLKRIRPIRTNHSNFDLRESPNSRRSCESIPAHHATKHGGVLPRRTGKHVGRK